MIDVGNFLIGAIIVVAAGVIIGLGFYYIRPGNSP